VVSLEEARRFQLRYGLEVSSEYSSALSQRTNAWGIAADLRDRNFLGRGMSLGGGMRYEPDLRSARGLFSVPKLANRPIRTNVYLTARGEEEATEDQVRVQDDEVELALEQRWRVGRAVEYSWGYSANWRDVRLTSATAEESLSFAGTLASLNGAAVIDRRDSFFDAKRGWFGSASMQWGERALGSDLDYLRTLVRGSYYQPLGQIVLAGNLRWGRLLPLGGLPPLTVFDLFFNAGGTESVRGYSQDALSAYDFLGAPLGGTKLLVGNAELRSPLFWRFGGVLFADAGNTFAEQQQVRFRDLAVGLGIGLRINTPLAPVRIDLGFPRRRGESGPRWHFSIGQMF
jgi:outer membrane protein insertion porin family